MSLFTCRAACRSTRFRALSNQTIGRAAATIAAFLLAVSPAAAVTIDFDSTPIGIYNLLTFPGVSITYTGGSGAFDVTNQVPGPPISGHSLISYFQIESAAPFRADFDVPVSSVSIGVGDYNDDEDHSYLAAYSAGDILLDSDYFFNLPTTYGGGTLSVASATPIAYVLFWDEDPFPGAVYWDNLTFEPVPEPGSLVLAGVGLALLGLFHRRRRD